MIEKIIKAINEFDWDIEDYDFIKYVYNIANDIKSDNNDGRFIYEDINRHKEMPKENINEDIYFEIIDKVDEEMRKSKDNKTVEKLNKVLRKIVYDDEFIKQKLYFTSYFAYVLLILTLRSIMYFIEMRTLEA